MPLCILNGTTLYFSHIPKTGGTSIEEYVRQNGKLAFKSSDKEQFIRIVQGQKTRTGTPIQHITTDLAEDIIPHCIYGHSFSVMRDPVARMMSEFFWRRQFNLLQPLGPTPRWDSVKEKFSKFNKSGRSIEDIFEDFVVRAFYDYHQDPMALNNHIRPQVDFTSENQKIFLFERGLEQVFEWIDSVCNLRSRQRPHENRTSKFKLSPKESTVRMIQDFYAADYELIAQIRKNA